MNRSAPPFPLKQRSGGFSRVRNVTVKPKWRHGSAIFAFAHDMPEVQIYKMWSMRLDGYTKCIGNPIFYRYTSIFGNLPPLLESVAVEESSFRRRGKIDRGAVPWTRTEMVELLLEIARQVRIRYAAGFPSVHTEAFLFFPPLD